MKKILQSLFTFILFFMTILEGFPTSNHDITFVEDEFSCNSAYQEINGLVVIEAENLTAPSGWVKPSSVSGYTGSGYLHWTGTEYFTRPGVALITTKITINTPGVYRFQMRSRVGFGNNIADHNDTWVRFPDASDYFALKGSSKIFPKGSGKSPNPNGAGSDGWFKVFMNSLNWTWNTFTSDNDAHDIFVQFDSPGEYTMELSARSTFHLIDRLVLHQNASNPLSLTNSETTCSNSGTTVPVSGISISPTSASILVGNTQQLSATVSPSNATNKTVIWSTSNANVASVNSSGLVTGIAAGSATITGRTQDGNFSATSSISVTQNSTNLSISGFILVIASNNSDIQSLTNGVQLLESQVGSLSLNVRANTNPSTVGSVQLTLVGPESASITENVAPYALFGDNNGNYFGRTLPNGNYTLTATPYSGTNLGGSAGQSSTIQFSIVSSTTVPVSGISISPTSASILVGNTQQLNATVSPSNATNKTVIWSTSNSNVASVSSSGLVTGVGVGSATITARTQDGNFTATSSINVTQSEANLSISGFILVNASNNSDIQTLTDGIQLLESQVGSLSLNIRANTNPSVVGSVRIALSGPVSQAITENVAPYALFGDNNGNYSGRTLPNGNYTLTATAYSGTNLSGSAGQSSTISFSIVSSTTVPVSGISVSPTSASILVGNTQQLSATVSPSNATNKTVIWSTSNANVASVSSSGLVTGVDSGTATITARTQDGNFTANASITVSVNTPNLGIVDFTLINASTNGDVLTISNGLVISQSQIQNLSLNIRANTNPAVVGSVFLSITGPVNASITENVAPYALFGDISGNYNGRTLPAGTYTLTATAYSGSNRSGTAGPTNTTSFQISSTNNRILDGAGEKGNVFTGNGDDDSILKSGKFGNEIFIQNLKVYPNPLKNEKLYISDQSWREGIINYSIYSNNGSKLMDGNYQIDESKTIEITLNKTKFPSGMYFIVLEGDLFFIPKRVSLIVQ